MVVCVLYVFWYPGGAYGERFVCVLIAWECIWGAFCMCFGSLRVHMGSVCFGGLGVHMGSVL